MQACELTQVQVPTCENCNFTCLDSNKTDAFTNNCLDNWECSFKVTSQSEVDTDEYEGRGDGNKNVFQVITSTIGDTLIADDEFTNILVFELEDAQTSFSVEGNELEDLNAHFRRLCFCTDVDFKEVSLGCIQGEKQSDGTWLVQGNITIPYSWGDIEMKFDAQFAM